MYIKFVLYQPTNFYSSFLTRNYYLIVITSLYIRISRALNLFDDLKQVLAVLVFQYGLSQLAHLRLVYPALAVGDAFKASHLQALAFLDDFNKG